MLKSSITAQAINIVLMNPKMYHRCFCIERYHLDGWARAPTHKSSLVVNIVVDKCYVHFFKFVPNSSWERTPNKKQGSKAHTEKSPTKSKAQKLTKNIKEQERPKEKKNKKKQKNKTKQNQKNKKRRPRLMPRLRKKCKESDL